MFALRLSRLNYRYKFGNSVCAGQNLKIAKTTTTVICFRGLSRGRNLSEAGVIVADNYRKINEMTAKKSGIMFTDYDCIGFDLDNTLSRYDVREMVQLEYKILAKFMVEYKNYPPLHLYKPVEENLDFLMKGLILDVEKGNILRVAGDGYILTASHGTKPLSRKEVLQYYPFAHWQPIDCFVTNPLHTWNGPYSEKMRTLLDYFDMPASLIFARSVDTLDQLSGHKLPKYNIWPDILSALQEMFDRDNFQLNRGDYFPTIKQDPSKYYLPCSDYLIRWLRDLHRASKLVFLVTGSNVDYADLTARNTLGSRWQDLFEIIICHAKKPGFFTDSRPFIGVEDFVETGIVEVKDLKVGGVYNNGNFDGLYQFFKKTTKKVKPKVLYVGDNLIQDIYTPAARTVCDTVAICEELEAEGAYGFPAVHTAQEYLKSSFWGSYFGSESHHLTIWRDIITNYSKLCIPSVEYAAERPINHVYRD